MKKKIIDFVGNYFAITVVMLLILAVLFGIYLGFMFVWNYSIVLFGILVIVLIVSGILTYFVTKEEE